MPGQLTSALPVRDGRRGIVLSASVELEPGFRAMLLHAEGLFRLDVAVREDTLQTYVRNRSTGPLAMGDVSPSGPGSSTALGEAPALAPGRSDLAFTLGAPGDGVAVTVVLNTLRHVDRGTATVSAQGIVRPLEPA